MNYKIFTGIIFIFVVIYCSNQQDEQELTCGDIHNEMCANYLGPIWLRSSIWDCPFLASDWMEDTTICLPPSNWICPASHELTFEMLKYYPPLNTPIDDEICSYSLKEIFNKTGKPINESNHFSLSFDENKRQLTLFTDIHEKYVRCYAHAINKTLKYINFNNMEPLKYEINIGKTPEIYFCTLLAPTILTKTLTNHVVASSETTSNQYIPDIKVVHDIKYSKSTLEMLSDDEGVESCSTTDFSIYGLRYFFFYCENLNRISFDVVQKFLDMQITDDLKEFVEYLRNKYYCPLNVTKTKGYKLYWNTTLLGSLATPSELCLDNSGMPVTRRCEGNFSTGAFWSEPSGNCSDEIEIPNKTLKLHQLIKMENIPEAFSNITAATNDFKEFTAADVHLLSEGLNTISNIKNVSTFEDDFLKGISNTMRVDSVVLRESQIRLNSTDKILDSIENFVVSIAEDITNSSAIRKRL